MSEQEKEEAARWIRWDTLANEIQGWNEYCEQESDEFSVDLEGINEA